MDMIDISTKTPCTEHQENKIKMFGIKMCQISTPKREMENKEAEAGIKNMRQSLTIGDYDCLSESKDINEMISSNALCVKLLAYDHSLMMMLHKRWS